MRAVLLLALLLLPLAQAAPYEVHVQGLKELEPEVMAVDSLLLVGLQIQLRCNDFPLLPYGTAVEFDATSRYLGGLETSEFSFGIGSLEPITFEDVQCGSPAGQSILRRSALLEVVRDRYASAGIWELQLTPRIVGQPLDGGEIVSFSSTQRIQVLPNAAILSSESRVEGQDLILKMEVGANAPTRLRIDTPAACTVEELEDELPYGAPVELEIRLPFECEDAYLGPIPLVLESQGTAVAVSLVQVAMPANVAVEETAPATAELQRSTPVPMALGLVALALAFVLRRA